MVKGLSMVFMAISLLICFVMPIALAIYFYRKERIALKAVLVGALVFIVFQLVLRIPLLQILGSMEWYKNRSSSIWFTALFLGITAGIFEEVGRYIGFKFFLKDKLERKNGIAYGIGHGGIEAILLVGMTYVNNLIYSSLINSGAFDKVIASNLPSDIAEKIRGALVDSQSYVFLLGGLERMFTMAIQIAFSLLVLYAVKNRKAIFLLIAVLLHGLVDAVVVILSGMKYTNAQIEVVVFIFAVIAVIFIFKSKNIFREENKGIIEA